MAQVRLQPTGPTATAGEPLIDNNTDYGGGLESQRRRQIGDAYRNYSGGQEATEDIYQRYLRDANYDTGIKEMFSQAQPQSGGNGGIFTDPATARWEQGVNYGAARLLTPQNNPDFQPYIDYMRNYFKQLQQPGYTPAQQDLIQTQALDPLERSKQQAIQDVRQRMAGKGVEGGLVERAVQDVERQFQQQRTTSQSNFATQQINMEQQRAQQAAQVAAATSQAQQAMATNDENRMLQALTLMFSIPQYADQRLSLAQGTLQQNNPSSLLALMNQINSQNAGNNQNQNAQNNQNMSQLMQLLAGLFGG